MPCLGPVGCRAWRRWDAPWRYGGYADEGVSCRSNECRGVCLHGWLPFNLKGTETEPQARLTQEGSKAGGIVLSGFVWQ
eukprot:364546-Chlamydomonas_euryale.AAC.2